MIVRQLAPEEINCLDSDPDFRKQFPDVLARLHDGFDSRPFLGTAEVTPQEQKDVLEFLQNRPAKKKNVLIEMIFRNAR